MRRPTASAKANCTRTLQRGNLELTEAEYFEIIDGKTADLTACCCRLGALLRRGRRRYSRTAGQLWPARSAWHSRSPTICSTWSAARRQAGKTLGTDLEQQKLTLPLIRMMATLPADAATELRKVLANGQPKRAAIASGLARTRAVEYARERAESLAAEAVAELDGLPESECGNLLRVLPYWAVRRET